MALDDKLLFSNSYQHSAVEILLVSLLATFAMTLFSVLISFFYKKDFEEPSLLGKIVNYYVKDAPMWLNHTFGYLIHFKVGFIFAGIQFYLYRFLTPAWYNAIIIGILNGVIGVIIWYVILKIYHNILKTHLSTYLIQLIFAHIVFSLVLLAMYVLPR